MIGTTEREETWRFVKALLGEDELGAVMRIHLYLEREINIFIEARISPKIVKIFKPTFSKKIQLALALDMPGELAPGLDWIGEKRNAFGHNIHAALSSKDVEDFFSKLTPELQAAALRPELFPSICNGRAFDQLSPRDKFSICATLLWLSLQLLNRTDGLSLNTRLAQALLHPDP